MLRFIFIILLLWSCGEIAAQGVSIQKSSDLVVIRGKSYYLHTVEPGQTLFSICKAYGVSLEEVKTLNDKKDNNLSLYEVLKIPYTEPFVQQDEKYFYHKVAKGETLYSIARHYGIRPKRLLKFNTNYSQNTPLAIGAVVRLPLNDIDNPVLKNTPPVLSSNDNQDNKETVSDTLVIESAPIMEEFPETTYPRNQYTISDYTEDSLYKEIPSYITEVVMPADPYVRVALLLPFFAREYPLYIDSLSDITPVKISARSEQFLAFYEGMLLAIDSLRNKGCKIDLHIFDTERNVEKMTEIARQLNQFSPDIIIGPVYGSVYKMLAEQLDKKTIPMVYPLSSRNENLGEYPNFVQVNTSFHSLAVSMVQWLNKESLSANIVSIDLNSGNTEDAEQQMLSGFLHEIPAIRFFDWNAAAIPLDSLRQFLLPDRENIILLPTAKEAEVSKILPALSALTDGYQITVIGFPEWQTFVSVDHETYYKLNTKIFSYSYVDYTTPAAQTLTDKYRKYFFTEPNSLAFKAFDMGIYFINLASKFRDRTLEALEYFPADGAFSRFRFQKIKDQAGKENHGFFIVNYGSDYQLKIQTL